MPKAKSHLRNVEDAVNPDGSLNTDALKAGNAHAIEQYENGNEKLLGVAHTVLHDGSVITSFHHVAADEVGAA